MAIVVGIDAAWTAKEPSGVALLVEEHGRWRCAALAPSYESFMVLAKGTHVTWSASRFTGGLAQPAALLDGARALAGDASVEVVAIDMPLSTAAG